MVTSRAIAQACHPEDDQECERRALDEKCRRAKYRTAADTAAIDCDRYRNHEGGDARMHPPTGERDTQSADIFGDEIDSHRHPTHCGEQPEPGHDEAGKAAECPAHVQVRT